MPLLENIRNRLPSKKKRRVIWIFLGLGAYASTFFFRFWPEGVERFYSNGLFVGIRWVFDHTLGALPFSIFYAFLGWVLFSSGWSLVKWFYLNMGRLRTSIRIRAKDTVLHLLSLCGQVTFWFLFLWGFNYFRVPIEDRLELKVGSMEQSKLYSEINRVHKQALTTRSQIEWADSSAVGYRHLPDGMETDIRLKVEEVMVELGYRVVGDVPLRMIRPKGFLTSLGVSGYYNPFLGEVNMDAAFSPLYIPFLMAHELTHGYGIADEGEANFIAYLACHRSSSAVVRYSADISYLLYLIQYSPNLRFQPSPRIEHDLIINGELRHQPQYERMILLVHAYLQAQNS